MKRTAAHFGMQSLAVLLSALMILHTIPTTVFAEIGDALQTEAEAIHSGFHTLSEAFELVEKRSESTKYFRNEDGTVVVAQYDLPVHYMNDAGDWQDIDNTLEASGSNYVSADSRIKFAKTITGNETLFTLHEQNRKITMSLDGAIKKTPGKVTEYASSEENLTTLQKMMSLNGLSSSILYTDILSGVDLEYVLESNSVKENIIVKEKQDSYAYTFTVKLNNLEAALTENDEIAICDPDSGDVIYSMPAPIVFDSKGSYAPEASANYSLVQTGNNEYSLTITVDTAWMHAQDRAYPVTVDPTIHAGQHVADQITDTYVSSSNTSTAYGSATMLRAGYDGSGYNRTYIALNTLPELPSEAYISSAQLNLRAYVSGSNYATSSAFQLAAYTIDMDSDSIWSESTMCWNDHTAAFTDILDYVSIAKSKTFTNNEVLTWDITKAARAWYAGNQTNLGIAVGLISETLTASRYVEFHSSDKTVSTSYVPFFTFTYTDTKGLEDYFSYQTASAGLAGSAYVNHATGVMTFTKSLMTTTDSLMPFTLSIIYNSFLSYCNYKYSNVNTAYKTGCVPYGFKLNVQETLLKKSYTNEANGTSNYYILTDADGTEHYFHQIEGSIKYADEDGLQLVLQETAPSTCTITDNSKMVRTFSTVNVPDSDVSGAWILTKITDKNGNAIIIEIDSASNDYRPLSISLKPKNSAQITFLTIHYNSNSRPYLILNEVSQEAVILRYSATAQGSLSTTTQKYLRKIVYAHGNSSTTLTDWENFYKNETNKNNITQDATTSYTFDSEARMTHARDDRTGCGLQFIYSGSTDIVTTVQEYANNESNLGQKCLLTYNGEYTDVRTSGSDDAYGTADDMITRYTLDERARVKSVYTTDPSGTQIYGAKSGVYETQEEVKNNLKSSAVVGGSATNYLLNGGFERGGDTIKYWTVSGGVEKISNTGAHDPDNRHYLRFDVADDTTSSISQNTHLDAGTYTLSLQVYTACAKNISARLVVTSLNGSNSTEEDIPINEYIGDGGEIFVSTEVKAASVANGGENFKIQIVVTCGSSIDSTAYVRIDSVMLEENKGSSKYTCVQRGNFENFIQQSISNTDLAADFWVAKSGTFTPVSTSAPFNNVARLSGSVTATNYIKQTVYTATAQEISSFTVYGYTGGAKTFIVSGFGKATGLVASDAGTFRIRADITYRTISGTNETVSEVFDFEKTCEDWQFVSGSFTTPEDKLVYSIVLYLDFSYQPSGSVAMFDNIALISANDGSVVSYEYYDNSGTSDGLMKSQKNGYYSEDYSYDSDRQLTQITNKRGERTEYTYDSVGNLTRELHFKNSSTPETATDYTYNAYGQMLTSSTYEITGSNGNYTAKSGTYYLNTTKTYQVTSGSRIFGALLSESDNLSKTIHYYYDEKNGRLLATVNQYSKNGTCYTYDGMGNLTSVRPATYVSSTSYTASGEEQVSYAYNSTTKLLDSITTGSTTYNFTYNNFGGTDSIAVGSQDLASYTYNENNGKLKKITYGNGFIVEYEYDELDNISKVWYTNNGTKTQAYEYTYTKYGQLCRFDNLLTGKSTLYEYNADGKLSAFVETDMSDAVNEFASRMGYNTQGQLDYVDYYFDYTYSSGITDHPSEYSYTYNDNDGSLKKMELTAASISGSISYTYDGYKRCSKKTTTFGSFCNTVDYEFEKMSGMTSVRVKTYSSTVNSTGNTYNYIYDANDNITKIVDDTKTWLYTYDDVGQLLSETVYTTSTGAGNKYVYTYDDAGNILTKTTYTYSNGTLTNGTTYTYTYGNANWGDLLTKYRGTTITYDAIGNPLSYYNGSSYTFTWKNGRQLGSAVKGLYSLSFNYNDEGIRTEKNVNGIIHYYYLSGSQIVAEEWTINSVTYVCVYLYDAEGSPIGMQYRTSSMGDGVFYTFWFEKNLQGDIVAVYNESGTKLISYSYDAWGNVTQTNHNTTGTNYYATYNPFKYRGYYYDSELGLYYLNSRYYDPLTGRFISADNYINANGGIIGHNMFAYCSNNPIKFSDPQGQSIILSAVIGILATTIAGAIAGAVSSATTNFIEQSTTKSLDEIDWKEVGASAAGGATSGGIMGFTAGLLTFTGATGGAVVVYSAIAGGVGSVASDLVENCINPDPDGYTRTDAIESAAWGAALGALGGLVTGPLEGVKKTAAKYGQSFAQGASKFMKKSWKNIGASALENAISGFNDWLTEESGGKIYE